ncbi:MAG: hypothetical protein OXF02_03175 [Simkaniaceae bacterium]|nr:hypothetical protein [Simkaniaceae bacterium]
MFEFFTKKRPVFSALVTTLVMMAGFGSSRLRAGEPSRHHRILVGHALGTHSTTHIREKKTITEGIRFSPGFSYEYLCANRPYLDMGWRTETDSSLQFGFGYVRIGYTLGNDSGSYAMAPYVGVGYINKPSDRTLCGGGLRFNFLVANNTELGIRTELRSLKDRLTEEAEPRLNVIALMVPLSWYPFGDGTCGITLAPEFLRTLKRGQGIDRRYEYGARLSVSFRI